MTRLLAFLKGVPLTVYAVIAAAGAFAGWLALDRAHQRELGKLEAEQKVKHAASDSATKVFTATITTLEGKVAVFGAALERNRAAKARTDVAAATLRSARDSLSEALQDSLATVEELRAKAARLIQASDSAEAAHQRERVSADSALASAKRATTFAVDSVKAASLGALNAAVARAGNAETRAAGRTGWKAKILQRGGLNAGWGVRANQPDVMLGCRIAP